MGWIDANPRLALTLRRLRGRFGIAAPRVAVRTHIPWYWRALSIIVLAAAAFALAGWIYDAGRRFAGYDHDETSQELASLRGRILELEGELDKVRRIANAGESSLQIERSTQQQLSNQVRLLEQENTRLKEDLAGFENLVQGEGRQGSIALSRLHVEPADASGKYRYHLLAALRGQQKSGEFNGMVKLVVILQGGGRDAIIQLPPESDQADKAYQVSIKQFRRIEGTFSVPNGARIKSVEVRLMQGGVTKASRTAVM